MLPSLFPLSFLLFFFNDTATTEIYTLSLHDALPISPTPRAPRSPWRPSRRTTPRPTLGSPRLRCPHLGGRQGEDRKSTRLNSSHGYISYAVFCLKKKNKTALSRQSERYNSVPSQHTR